MDSTNQIKARFTKSMMIDSTASKLFTKIPILTNQIHRKKSLPRKHQSFARLWRKNISNNGSTKIAPKILTIQTQSGNYTSFENGWSEFRGRLFWKWMSRKSRFKKTSIFEEITFFVSSNRNALFKTEMNLRSRENDFMVTAVKSVVTSGQISVANTAMWAV